MAGARSVEVSDSYGTYAATPVLFDPNLDIAILRVSGLAGRTLVLATLDKDAWDTGMENGSDAMVMGYPGGGNFTTTPAIITEAWAVNNLDIYHKLGVVVDLSVLRAYVAPGNSGGPLIQADGRVVGMVVGRSFTDEKNEGYAIPTHQFISQVCQAVNWQDRVSTQSCLTL